MAAATCDVHDGWPDIVGHVQPPLSSVLGSKPNSPCDGLHAHTLDMAQLTMVRGSSSPGTTFHSVIRVLRPCSLGVRGSVARVLF
jgi:hypothetical protein